MTTIQEIYSLDWWFSFIDWNWKKVYNLINNVVNIVIDKEMTTWVMLMSY